MLRVVSPETAIEWTHPDDTGEPKTVFHLMPVSFGAMKRMAALSSGGEGLAEDGQNALIEETVTKIELGNGDVYANHAEIAQFIEALPCTLVPALFAKLNKMMLPTETESKN